MLTFIPGQRWISDAELQMGLGTVLASDQRSVTVLFLSTGETRIYSTSTAPLRRALFNVGDTIKSHEGWFLRVESFKEANGLITYVGRASDGVHSELPEAQLDNFIQVNRPSERMLSGQFDSNKHFELRKRTLQIANRLGYSELRGLTGGRTSLIPHQLYIAHEVAHRYAPRVLLADEVGLGKTIEAGMIIHQQLLLNLAQRVLIVVPETLIHQWLVEMLRRFNLQFNIFNRERCAPTKFENGELDDSNPFESEQLVLCSLEFLTNNRKYQQKLIDAGWDLLVVDEAHHLEWSELAPSSEYQMVEQLAQTIRGVLLLTATPEQLGKSGHFARLRLLDPDRFPSFSAFVEEEKHYRPIAQAVDELLGENDPSAETLLVLQATFPEGDNAELLDKLSERAVRETLVEHLLDRHGTGRVLFRNTRSAIKGFPGRELHSYPLPLPAVYVNNRISPELAYEGDAPWTDFDPRVAWLGEKLKQLRPHKVLVIAASADTAMDLAAALRINTGIHAAVFHEGLSIIERDRAAAYFADMEGGTQVLICSEIGSEGRNFQFAHHMVLFDLPINPDLLEQRIGRLDRIGQTQVIKIHVPYLENSAQQTLLEWYQQGLNAFEQTCPAGHSVFTQVREQLLDQINHPGDLAGLIATTRQLYQEKNEQLQQGRDRLLEYNSCRPQQAKYLVAQAEDADDSDLPDYLEHLYDCYGVDMEDHVGDSYLISQGDKMQHAFPCLQEEGMVITCDRATALANEDMHFITWEHPMVSGAMEMLLTSELGNCSIATIKTDKVRQGSLLLEVVYVLESAAHDVNPSRYLPPTSIRVLVDVNGNNIDQILHHDILRKHASKVDKATANKVVRAYAEPLRNMLVAADKLAAQQAPEILAGAHQKARTVLEREINRLQALRKVNPNVREEEIEFFANEWKNLDMVLETVQPRLDALRVVVTL